MYELPPSYPDPAPVHGAQATSLPTAPVAAAETVDLTTFERPARPRPAIPGHDHPLAVTPLVPVDTLRQHNVFLATDTRFAAAARLLAAMWRQAQDLPAGYVRAARPEATRTKLGSRLSPKAARAGLTFVDPAITSYAREALLFREPGAVWDEGRLWANLLSSQALTLNLLAPMALNLDLATADLTGWLWTGLIERISQDQRSWG